MSKLAKRFPKKAYDQKVHHRDFPPLNPGSVRELAIDGNEKILMKLNPKDAPLKRAGRPPNRQTRKPYSNAWLFITDPLTSRILCVEYMHEPENNEVKIRALQKVLHIYKNVDCIIHDLACKLGPHIESRNLFS